MEQIVSPARRFSGVVEVPGDKSISIRALLCGALCDGGVPVTGLGTGGDVVSARRCITALGIPVEDTGEGILIHGRGLHGLQPPSGALDCGNSGTTMRLLCGLLAGQRFSTMLTGDASLSKRPMDRVTVPLSRMGAQFAGQGSRMTAPIRIQGGTLQGMTYESPVASAQVKSSILLAGLYARGETTVIEPARSRDHTERMLRHLGAKVESAGPRVTLRGCDALQAGPLRMPGDLSAAAFLLAAAVLTPGGRVTVRHVGVNPTRTGFLDVLGWMGVPVDMENLRDENGEPVADLTVTHGPVSPVDIDGAIIPRVIDEIPVLAVLAAAANGVTEIRDAKELRVKETDRIAAVAENLMRMGVKVDVMEDGMRIHGGGGFTGAAIETQDDHRIAMAFAVAGLIAKGRTVIPGAEWADISFPGFFDVLKTLTGE